MTLKRGLLLNQFIVLATNAHAGQFDKAGEPYILHIFEVLAIGHDLFEDTKITEDDVIAIGGTDRIIKGMFALTKLPGQSYERYVQAVLNNVDAMRVKMGDLKHNSDITRLKGITDKDITRMGKYMVFYTVIKQKLDSL